MTDQPKTVAELREIAANHGSPLCNADGPVHDQAVLALDELARRAEANERLRLPDSLRRTIELNFDNCPSCGRGVDTGWECNGCGKDWKPLVDLALTEPAEPAKPEPVPDTARAEGDKVLREFLDLDPERSMVQCRPEDHFAIGAVIEAVDQLASVATVLARRALEGK